MVIYEHGSWRSKWARLVKRLFIIVGPNLTLRRALNLTLLAYDQFFLRPKMWGCPHTLYLEISSRCNLRCPGCLSFDGSYHDRLMPLKEFKHIVDHFAPYLLDLELYGWGEPFLNQDIFEMIQYAKGKKLFVRTSSNFNSFKPRDPEQIVRSRLDQINASIDGTTQEVYRRYRKGASLDVALDNLRRLVEAKKRLGTNRPLVEWQFIVSKINYHQIESAKKLAAEIGVDILRLDLPFSITHIDEMDDPEAESKWLADDPEFRQWADTQKSDGYADPRACAYLWSALQVDAEGQINPCPNRIGSKIQCGAATSLAVRDIWNQPVFEEGRKLFAKHAKAPPTFRGPCFNCKEFWQPWKSMWPEYADLSPASNKTASDDSE